MDYPGKVITKNQVTPTQTSATGVWTLDDAAAATRNNNWPVAGVPNPISKSLRFNSPDTAYLNRTPTTASNLQTWTWSGWVKRSGLGARQGIFVSTNSAGGDYTGLEFLANDKLAFDANDANVTERFRLETNAVFRDPSAWYHIVVFFNTTNATASNRAAIYVNGVLQTYSTATYMPQNYNGRINTTNQHNLSSWLTAAGLYLNGYMTEINFIDGQALTPSSFGMTDPVTGVWEPLKYSGTYGTNGFYLNFKDATSTTTLGLDYSGNANNWTANGFVVTPPTSAGNDSVTDVPTPWVAYNTTGDVGGLVRGNYCTLNPLNKAPSDVVLSNGNLEAASSFTSDHRCFAATFQVTSGKWYWEVQYATGTISAGSNIVGIFNLPTPDTANNRRPADSVNNGIGIRQDGQSESDNTSAAYFGSSIAVGDIIGIKLDADAGTVAFNVNGGSFGSTLTFVSAGGVYTPGGDIRASSGTPKTIHNFGQRAFAYTPPSGFRSLCTTNLEASTVLKGSDYFNPVLYTGNGSTQTITGVGFQPDWVWIKSRGSSGNHSETDVLRGVNKQLFPNLTDAEGSQTDQVTAFNSDGFSLGANASGTGSVNVNTITYVAWNWKANGAGVTNTAGSITSTVSANTTSGFAVVTAARQNNTSTLTIGHGLGAAPTMLIGKSRNGTGGWAVWHNALATNELVYLNSTAAKSVDGGTPPAAFTATSLTTFTVQNWNRMIGNGVDGVFYAFAPISGFSAFGSYTGNNSADGPFVYLGFRPKYILRKGITTPGINWGIIDTSRSPYNVSNAGLLANTSGAETTLADIDILSNGFKVRSASFNASSEPYIYAAFAENPFKNALAR
jgi:hypothetical protein